ncbi:Avr1b-1 avirulence-like protein [Phytophthora sojae]|uniref:RxLR effector protein n=2 Tax=Phytophthora sojae TaxID=67593 RepID=G4YN04_PHYSP|nr:Avr1b-1 avirulence-like protein [Phytophthora sojae]AEK80648.1 Avh94b [Phytophthora sojae]AEK80649.1 Avh94b [Phytophthora sojae]AEK80650.1 Avh94b [Phytophthora sojae]EGZ29537.1 Avr1b-1 avirulence-like protein [Phytophthora sojae]|eukprot:XP_009516812.1 Avr1b-1 avirulence-like protein [Phytophthora sojae]
MRFCFVVLVAAVALFSTTNTVAAANTKVESSDAVRALADQNNVDVERLLRIVEETEDVEDRAVGASVLQKLKDAVMKIKFSSWYNAKMTPTEVNTMLIAQGGKVDWVVATAYAAYFRNLKYGPYGIDMVNRKKKEEEDTA